MQKSGARGRQGEFQAVATVQGRAADRAPPVTRSGFSSRVCVRVLCPPQKAETPVTGGTPPRVLYSLAEEINVITKLQYELSFNIYCIDMTCSV